MKIDIREEHRWLQRMLGEWQFEGACDMGDGKPPAAFKGREAVRALGGIWIIGEGEGHSPEGEEHRSVMTLGYDPARGQFLGTFISSMMTHLWSYQGTLSGQVLTLDTQGPSFAGDGGTGEIFAGALV